MKYYKTIVFLAIASCSFFACQEDKARLPEESIKLYEDSISTNPSQSLYLSLTKAYDDYIKANPEAEELPDYLIKAYKSSKAAGNMKQALSYCERAYENYPQHEKGEAGLFLLAFSYENEASVKNLAKAKELYEKFLKEYPNSEYAPSAQVALDNLGLSPEELLNKIQGKKDSIQ